MESTAYCLPPFSLNLAPICGTLSAFCRVQKKIIDAVNSVQHALGAGVGLHHLLCLHQEC